MDNYDFSPYSVVGCADPVVPIYGWLRRTADEALIGCDADPDNERWQMTCRNHIWTGETGNCTHGKGCVRGYSSKGQFRVDNSHG